MLFSQVLALLELGLDLTSGIGPFVVDSLVADLKVDIELGLANIDADVEELVGSRT